MVRSHCLAPKLGMIPWGHRTIEAAGGVGLRFMREGRGLLRWQPVERQAAFAVAVLPALPVLSMGRSLSHFPAAGLYVAASGFLMRGGWSVPSVPRCMSPLMPSRRVADLFAAADFTCPDFGRSGRRR
jgi:hypothetical protein